MFCANTGLGRELGIVTDADGAAPVPSGGP